VEADSFLRVGGGKLLETSDFLHIGPTYRTAWNTLVERGTEIVLHHMHMHTWAAAACMHMHTSLNPRINIGILVN
jgi:hypothetical protein